MKKELVIWAFILLIVIIVIPPVAPAAAGAWALVALLGAK